MLEMILKICGLLGGLAALDYFWGKWSIAEIIGILIGLVTIYYFWEKCYQWLRKKFRSKEVFLEAAEGIVPINSSFYVERFPIESEYKTIESDCYEKISQSGTLIRIKAPQKMGKTSLLTRILHHTKQQNYRTACVSFHEPDSEVFADLDQFLRWFCTSVTIELKLPNKLDDYWQDKHKGSKGKCQSYFQDYLLSESDSLFVLGLDEVELLFPYPKIASVFF
jgi:hypothetical protein